MIMHVVALSMIVAPIAVYPGGATGCARQADAIEYRGNTYWRANDFVNASLERVRLAEFIEKCVEHTPAGEEHDKLLVFAAEKYIDAARLAHAAGKTNLASDLLERGNAKLLLRLKSFADLDSGSREVARYYLQAVQRCKNGHWGDMHLL